MIVKKNESLLSSFLEGGYFMAGLEVTVRPNVINWIIQLKRSKSTISRELRRMRLLLTSPRHIAH